MWYNSIGGDEVTLKDELEALKMENEVLKKELTGVIEKPKYKLIKLLNKELDLPRTRVTTDFLNKIEILTKSIKSLGGE